MRVLLAGGDDADTPPAAATGGLPKETADAEATDPAGGVTPVGGVDASLSFDSLAWSAAAPSTGGPSATTTREVSIREVGEEDHGRTVTSRAGDGRCWRLVESRAHTTPRHE